MEDQVTELAPLEPPNARGGLADAEYIGMQTCRKRNNGGEEKTEGESYEDDPPFHYSITAVSKVKV